jgi:hypothetical protein
MRTHHHFAWITALAVGLGACSGNSTGNGVGLGGNAGAISSATGANAGTGPASGGSAGESASGGATGDGGTNSGGTRPEGGSSAGGTRTGGRNGGGTDASGGANAGGTESGGTQPDGGSSAGGTPSGGTGAEGGTNPGSGGEGGGNAGGSGGGVGEIPSIIVSPTSGLQTSELGGTDTFTVVLGAAPVADVTIDLSSSDPDEGTVDTDSLVFTSDDWDTPQTVTVTGVDDDASDGPVSYTIATTASSDDPAYDGLAVDDVAVINLDDELSVPAILVSPTSGLETTEGGDAATFSVFLGTQPTASVGLSLTVGDTSEGSLDKTTLIFSTTNWSTPQTLTVTGLDDGIDDGDVTYTISATVVSTDADYATLEVPEVSVTNADDDEVGITVSAASILETSEYGDAVSFTVVLDCQPASTVAIPISSSDESEGTVSAVNLSFSTSNWDVPQTVTVTGVNDTDIDDDIPYTVLIEPASSSDPAYDGLDAPDVILVNLDNDPVVACGNPDMIDDLEDGDLSICENGGRTGQWYAYNESTSSSTSHELDVALLTTPRQDSIVAVETIGSSVNNWGATMGVSLYGVDISTRLPYDISGYTGIRFWARRGSASSYPSTVTVQIVQENTANSSQGGTCVDSTSIECSDHFGDVISVSSSWNQYELPFSGFYQVGWGTSFSRDLEKVLGFEFLIEYSSFDLMVDDLELY